MKQANTKELHIRIPEEMLINLCGFAGQMGLNKTEFVTLAINRFIKDLPFDFVLEGVDFKRIATLRYYKQLRDINKIARNELMSKFTFMKRLKTDLYKIVKYEKNPDKLRLKGESLLKERKEEILLYKDNKDLLEEFENYKIEIEKILSNMKNHLNNEIKDYSYIENDKKNRT